MTDGMFDQVTLIRRKQNSSRRHAKRVTQNTLNSILSQDSSAYGHGDQGHVIFDAVVKMVEDMSTKYISGKKVIFIKPLTVTHTKIILYPVTKLNLKAHLVARSLWKNTRKATQDKKTYLNAHQLAIQALKALWPINPQNSAAKMQCCDLTQSKLILFQKGFLKISTVSAT